MHSALQLLNLHVRTYPGTTQSQVDTFPYENVWPDVALIRSNSSLI